MPDIRTAKKMIDMKESPMDKKDKGMVEPVTLPSKSSGPSYPYGLKITLNKEQLSKMKLKPKDFTVGDMVDISALAKVVRLSETESSDYTDKSIELQITKLAVV